MNVVFVGGGSYRTLPIVRGALQDPRVLDGGEIRLVDFNRERVEAVGRLIMRTPEFVASGCTLTWTDTLERALPGADVVSVSFPVGSSVANALSEQACDEAGLFGTDQLSVSGAFRSVIGGTVLLDIARKMERHCPTAWLFDYANPVAVYSGMVNNHTKIRALGICGGFINHRWDLSRLLFRKDEYTVFEEVASAGINHCSILLRGKWKGKDLYALMDKEINRKGWTPCRMTAYKRMEKTIRYGLQRMAEMRHRFGYVLFSSESDGMHHVFPEMYLERPKKAYPGLAQLRANAKRAATARKAHDARFAAHLSHDLTAAFWAQDRFANPDFAANPSDAAVNVLRGLGGVSPEWLTASMPNRGAVKDFPDRAVLEFSLTLDRQGVHPDRDLAIPACFYGLIASLSMHHTLLGDAIATGDPTLFARALFAYPLNQNAPATRALWKRLLAIHRAELPTPFHKLPL
ncbi:MAG: hypothetical protein FWF84_06300 [Kiritimatiellaeota bacterium]|nr:hypothetical protein [Kiritimatiellota bacterium]